MKQSVVEINGNMYRYAYNSETGLTEYLGPVGSSPDLTEDEFLDEFFKLSELAERQFRKAGIKIDDVNDELTDASVKIVRGADDPTAEIRLFEEGVPGSHLLHRGSSIPTSTYAQAMSEGVDLYLEHGKERPIRIGPKTTVKITDDGRDQPGGKGKGRVTKLSSKIRYHLVKKGEIDMDMLTDLVDNKDMDKVEEMVESLIQKGELVVVN